MPPNVLYVVAHDVRSDMSGANLDALIAAGGTRFGFAFAQAPFCVPSRHSFFTGRRPAATAVHSWFNQAHPRAASWNNVARAFKRSGYETQSIGSTLERPHLLNPVGLCSPSMPAASRLNCWTSNESHAAMKHRCFGWCPPHHDLHAAQVASAQMRDWAVRQGSAVGSRPPPFFLMVGLVSAHCRTCSPPLPYNVTASALDSAHALAHMRGLNMTEALAATSLPTQSNEYTAPFFQRSCTTDSCITAWHNGAYAAYYQLDLALGVPLPEFSRLARATTRVGA